MRRTAPLILGAGPAGCAAAITLAEHGVQPIVLDRDPLARDPLCGGFLSWRTAEQLRTLGVDPAKIGAERVERVTLFAGARTAAVALPGTAYALSRHALDNALRSRAIEAGARLEADTARGIDGMRVIGHRASWSGDGLFLATGKHDVRAVARPRRAPDPALGLRLRLPATPARADLLGGSIELHLFSRGYAGIVLQEDGTANVCLAVRKSLLGRLGGNPGDLLGALAARHPAFGERLGNDWRAAPVETIGAVPYGWIARHTAPGLFRLGDQGAVIPSLAGEGIAIALASGVLAASVWLDHGAAGAARYQQRLAALAGPPVRAARVARGLAESPLGGPLGTMLAKHVPSALRWLIEASRIEPAGWVAQPSAAP